MHVKWRPRVDFAEIAFIKFFIIRVEFFFSRKSELFSLTFLLKFEKKIRIDRQICESKKKKIATSVKKQKKKQVDSDRHNKPHSNYSKG